MERLFGSIVAFFEGTAEKGVKNAVLLLLTC
jgi:hypothetical protein